MSIAARLKFWMKRPPLPAHLATGRAGEAAARKFLEQKGLKFLTANFKGKRGEIDLVFRDGDCLVFVEVKTRSPGSWTAPARAVDREKRIALARTAADYLRLLKGESICFRFDVVEVIIESGEVREIRHIEGSFNLQNLYRPKRR
jgi:putative endonuclease